VLHRLVLLRHAKSDYPSGVADHDRPLNGRGRRDAPVAGEWLRANGILPDHVIVSSARRTGDTWTAVRKQWSESKVAFSGPVTVDPRVYEATALELRDIVRDLPERVGTALLVGHNPGCEDLVSLLAGPGLGDPEAWAAVRRKYPTNGIAILESTAPWSTWTNGLVSLTGFTAPRSD